MRDLTVVLLLAGCSETGFHSIVDKETDTGTVAPDTEPEPTTPQTTPTTPEPTPTTPTTTTTPTTPTTPTTTTTPTTPTTVPEPVEPIADAGPDLIHLAGDLATFDGTASYDPDGAPIAAWAWQIVAAPYGSLATLATTDTPTVDLLLDLDGVYELELTVQSALGVWDSTPDHVVLIGEPAPPVADAGSDTVYEPLDFVTLDGTGSYDPGGYEPLTYSWTVVSMPTNSTAVLDDPTDAQPTFFADLAGDYVFELSVTNTLGDPDPTPDLVTITTTPADGFYVEVSWGNLADLDLHLLNSSAASIFDCPFDCNYDRPNPNWGLVGNADDPSLDEDTIPGVSGAGPEIITIDAPVTDVYTVMVHYYGRDGLSSCPSANCADVTATVNIYLGGVLAATFVDSLYDDDDVWEVATIDWPSGLITPLNTLSSTTRTICY